MAQRKIILFQSSDDKLQSNISKLQAKYGNDVTFVTQEECEYTDMGGYKKSLIQSTMYKGQVDGAHKVQWKLNLSKLYANKGADDASTPVSRGDDGSTQDAWASNIFRVEPSEKMFQTVDNWVATTSRDSQGNVLFRESDARMLGKEPTPFALEVRFDTGFVFVEFDDEPAIINGRQVYNITHFEYNPKSLMVRKSGGYSLSASHSDLDLDGQPEVQADKPVPAETQPQAESTPAPTPAAAGGLF